VISFNDSVSLDGGAPFGDENGNLFGPGVILSGGGLTVTGNSTSNVATLIVSGSANIAAEFAVQKDVFFNGTTTITGKLEVEGNCTFDGPVNVSGDNAEVLVQRRLNINANLTIDAGTLTSNNAEEDYGVAWNSGNITLQNNATIDNIGRFVIGLESES